MKWIHNEKASLGWAVFVELAVHALFAFQAFLLGGFLGEIALTAIFGSYGAAIGAWALAIFIFGAAFQAFVLGEYMKEHVQSYEDSGKDGSYLRSWKQVRWLVAGLEISSLLFRSIVVMSQGDFLQAAVVALFGAIALWYAFAQAKVIHASVNRPIEHDLERSQHRAGLTLAEKAMKYTDRMSPEQLARWSYGDASALQEVAESGFFEEEQKRQSKLTRVLNEQEQEEDRKEKRERAKDSARNLLNPASWKRTKVDSAPKNDSPFLEALTNSQANRQSQNGRHN